MNDLTEKLKELLMGCDITIARSIGIYNSDFLGYYPSSRFAEAIVKQLAPEIEKMLLRESWSRDMPNKQGYWWQWDGDSEPMIWSVLFSGTANDYFCSLGQNGLHSAVDCKEMGGWWRPCPIPSTPKIEPIMKGPMG